MDMFSLMFFIGNVYCVLVEDVVYCLGMLLGKVLVGIFSDGEV